MTMTFAGDRPQLADVKATDWAYPLYGELETLPPHVKFEPGTGLLGVKVGDSVDVGDTSLKIIGDVIQEPDSDFNLFQTAPLLLINLSDVEKTVAIQPGSRLSYLYMFAGITRCYRTI